MKIEIFDINAFTSMNADGIAANPEFYRVSNHLKPLVASGASVKRFHLSSHVDEFLARESITALMQKHGQAALPIIYVDGEVVCFGAYPSDTLFQELLARLS